MAALGWAALLAIRPVVPLYSFPMPAAGASLPYLHFSPFGWQRMKLPGGGIDQSGVDCVYLKKRCPRSHGVVAGLDLRRDRRVPADGLFGQPCNFVYYSLRKLC
jgi:hypothetical protein